MLFVKTDSCCVIFAPYFVVQFQNPLFSIRIRCPVVVVTALIAVVHVSNTHRLMAGTCPALIADVVVTPSVQL